jgi:trehalose 6-phosphate synthase/phosphatase
MDDSETETTATNDQPRLVIVSNRLPIVLNKNEQGTWEAVRGSGGLVTAMAPVLRDRGGLWIGWPGTSDVPADEVKDALAKLGGKAGFTLEPVPLTEEERLKYYQGFSNEIIWPLFHDMIPRCNFDPTYWDCYRQVNGKFARAVQEHLESRDFIWIHDYHLMFMAQELRTRGAKNKLGFFLHIPFPPLDIFVRAPWRRQILKALLEFDLIGFQTLRDLRNFVICAQTLIRGCEAEGDGHVVDLSCGKRTVRLGAFPISIDFQEFADRAATDEVSDRAWTIHRHLPDRQIILGIDRLDYTKGIIERLEAFRNTLIRYPDLLGKIVFVQVVVPSRREIPEYSDLKIEIERLVGEINGQFTRAGWVPLHYIFRSLDRIELVSYYRTAEIALITPLKDGMNLIAKEYCACSLEENCVLILSEFAGAAAQFQQDALLVNPFDIEGVADAIHQAFYMPLDERQKRMQHLRASIKEHDIYWWVDSFLQAAIARDLKSFPKVELEDYLPQYELV